MLQHLSIEFDLLQTSVIKFVQGTFKCYLNVFRGGGRGLSLPTEYVPKHAAVLVLAVKIQFVSVWVRGPKELIEQVVGVPSKSIAADHRCNELAPIEGITYFHFC